MHINYRIIFSYVTSGRHEFSAQPSEICDNAVECKAGRRKENAEEWHVDC
jgi:hypothetical protein